MKQWPARIPVLIVGGGPSGLLSAALLARQGVPSLLVERHSATSTHPKARGVTVRSMEIFRQCGLEDAMRKVAPATEHTRQFAVASTLVDPGLNKMPFAIGDQDPIETSPTTGLICSQDALEAVLFDHVQSLSEVTLGFGSELTMLEPGTRGVTATIAVDDNRTRQLEADYVIAADGAQSGIRSSLGLDFRGELDMHHNINVMFEADLGEKLRPLECVFVIIKNDDTTGVLSGIPTYRNDNEWTYNFQYFPERGVQLDDFGAAPWQSQGAVIDRFRVGRVLFVGDAAHVVTPAGGLGMNTGLLDVHNLAWRLAAIFRGASERLLDDYASERHSEASLIVEATVENLRRAQTPSGIRTEGIRDLWSQPQHGITLGYSLSSDSVLADGSAPPEVEDPYLDYVPAAGVDWLQAADIVRAKAAVRLDAYDVSTLTHANDVYRSWLTLYEIDESGAVLVRPDGTVAWRQAQANADARQNLADVLYRILGHSELQSLKGQ
jgi:putative polyketide hydroxylase